jgi:transcriptional antiterminator RfaH
MSEWYLIHAKTGQERKVRDRLTVELPELFLPLLKTRIHRCQRLVESIVPLFPCYLFACFDMESHYRRVRYTPGVRQVLHTSGELLIVAHSIIEVLKDRCIGGVMETRQPALSRGQRVQVVDGPFHGFDAIFEDYLPGRERVRILLSAVSGSGPRLLLPVSSLAPDPEYNRPRIRVSPAQ